MCYSLCRLYLEVFPELCTVKMNQQINATTDINLIKRNMKTLQQSNPNSPSTDHQQQNQQQQHPITRTVSRGKRWLFVLVVFVYLILSKLIARSTSSA